MQIYTWIIEHSDILGVLIDILALVTSIVLTILIYRLERRNDKRLKEAEESARNMMPK